MTLPAGFPYPLNQVVEIPLEQIIPNPEQPRRSMRKDTLEELAASMRVKGQEVPAPVRPLTEAERAANPGAWVMLVGGHRRRLAALINQFKTLKCTVKDITPEETHHAAVTDNLHEEMDWWDWDLAIEKQAQLTKKTQAELIGWMGKSKGKIYKALTITKALNQAARALVDENLDKTLKNDDSSRVTKNKAFLITEENLLTLSGLENPDQVLKALQAVLDDYLTADQTQKLVEHMNTGNPIETFSPTAKPSPRSTSHKPTEPATHPTHHGESQPASVDAHQPATHSHPVHTPTSAASVNGHHQEPLAQPSHAHRLEASAQVPTPANLENQPEDNWFWKMMVGIKFFNQLRSKVKKGEPLTGWEKCFVWGHAVLKGLGKFLKFLKKLFEPLAKTIGHAAKKALGDTLSGLLVLLFRVALICLLVWAVIKVIDYGLVYPWHWVERKAAWALDGGLWSPKSVTPVPTPVSTPPPVVPQAVRSSKLEGAKLKTKTSNSTSVAVYQPSITFNTAASPSDSSGVLTTLYDPKLLEQEIAALPQNCIVTAYPVLPDEGIPGDLAVTRLQDLMDPDKYTLMIGSGKYKIMNITATTTGLIINYQNTDIIDVFNHGGTATYVWEDMLYIHTDEIEQVRSSELGSSQLKTSNSSLLTSNPGNVIYHCTLIGAGAKNALTFRCGRADDLKHLVSALEYFIRNSRLGHDTALAGMPYPSQGVWLDNHWIVKLWAGSPIDKAGARLNDLVWSMDKDTQSPQDDKKLKSRLDVLTSGAYPLFIYSPGAGDNLGIDRNEFHTGNFSPRRRKIIFSVP